MLDRAGNRLLVLALLLTLVLWNVPYGGAVLYPFKLFATWLHEGSHGLLMILTGAGLDRLEIFRDTSGLAHPARSLPAGLQTLVSSAGYMGTAVFGALFLVLGRTDRGGRRVLAVLGALMIVSAVVAIRNTWGVISISMMGGVLVALALLGPEKICAFTVSFLAAQSCINSVLDIRVLFGATFYVNGQPRASSDADRVAGLVGGPAWMWASLWLLWSFGLFYLALRAVAPARIRGFRLPGPGRRPRRTRVISTAWGGNEPTEIGIRRAIGAQTRHIAGLLVGRSAVLAAAGVAVGLVVALATTRLLGTMLFGVSPADPLTLSGAAALLFLVALVASWLPARGTLAIDPLEALR